MQRTAAHLVGAANPAQLEMRILANHGSDARFAFMRAGGRSWNVWLRVKQEAEAKVKRERESKNGGGIGALAGYSSDEEDEEETPDFLPPPPSSNPPPAPPSPPPLPPSPSDPPPSLDTSSTDETAKTIRRDKARLWVEQRRNGGAA